MLKNLQVLDKVMFSNLYIYRYNVNLNLNLSSYRISNINCQIFRTHIIFIRNKN